MPTAPPVFRHRPKVESERDRKRNVDRHKNPASVALYNSVAWRRSRLVFLSEHPICAACGKRLATVVDHIEPHRGDPLKFWDQSNWQALDERCHNAKTAREVNGRRA